MAAAGGTAEHGTPLPLCAVVRIDRQRRTTLYSASRLRSPGGALESRESLTQDSRSAVKARLLIPYGNHSARSVALLAEMA